MRKIVIFTSSHACKSWQSLINENSCYRVVAIVYSDRCDVVSARDVPCMSLKKYTKEAYQYILQEYQADMSILIEWPRLVIGLDPKTTINVHFGALPQFGGKGMYGDKLLMQILESLQNKKIRYMTWTCQFVFDDGQYNTGPIISQVYMDPQHNMMDMKQYVRLYTKNFLPRIVRAIISGKIRWDGKNTDTLQISQGLSTSNNIKLGFNKRADCLLIFFIRSY